jgi:formate dehydrogenase iron-sulfur subunit
MLALADSKLETLRSRGYKHASVYNPAGVGGTHMMYVVPHGDRLEDYDLPADPTASPLPMTSLGFLKRLGGYLFGVSILGTLAHLLAFGQQRADEEL